MGELVASLGGRADVEDEHEDDDEELGAVLTAASGGLRHIFENL